MPIEGVVLFMYSSQYIGVNLVGEGGIRLWQREVYAAPVAVCGHSPLVCGGPYASAPSHVLLGGLMTSGFVYCAIPDRVQDQALEWVATR